LFTGVVATSNNSSRCQCAGINDTSDHRKFVPRLTPAIILRLFLLYNRRMMLRLEKLLLKPDRILSQIFLSEFSVAQWYQPNSYMKMSGGQLFWSFK
jgi:hypothetical protein